MRIVSACIAIALCICAAPAATRRPGLQVEPSKTRVGLARVHLEVSDLQLTELGLEGTYEVRVPLSPSRNDRGTVRFALDGPLEVVVAGGSALHGTGRSALDGHPISISCRFDGGDRVRIRVETRGRILDFRTRYSMPASVLDS